MKNGDKPAYPVECNWSNGQIHGLQTGEYTGFATGLTAREVFAKDAPPMPDWFEYTSKLKPPKEPKSWVDMPEGDDQNDCKNWQHDTECELPEHLQWYSQAWEKYWDEREAYYQALKSEKYFAWRLYFADELLKQLGE